MVKKMVSALYSALRNDIDTVMCSHPMCTPTHLPIYSQESKVYVQDRMVESAPAAALASVLTHPEGVVYIAGNATRMPDDVKRALGRVLAGSTGMSEVATDKAISDLVKRRRIQVECWS